MEDDFLKEHGLMTEKELEQMDERFRKREEEGLKNLLKHFDRIHDKLFMFNNILIAGYFALSKIEKSISLLTILIPISNLAFLIFIEYRMLEKSRFEASITEKPLADISKYGKSIRQTNVYSLLSIISTAIVALFFLYYLFH
jgi:hypothetical protein